ncbi:hypothetical protein VB715_11540 [Crocosphaera sp. UHCC 0190]|uniref:hypothetical protein n=1 Tax=Crocosphaera sp. UHCC 0190 TaxID=3110246 RepID=UPI002B2022CA|nr:hypothetical protein [Crocosphaera sp. UHCC 0190]MEA5510398.1 hypothetical protein [Crocosphaera sp. UHCC 0190]
MLFCKSFLPSLTHLSFLSISFFLGLGTLNGLPAVAAQKGAPNPQNRVAQSPLLAQTSSSHLLANGVYLYGRSPHAEEIGQEYMVFRIEKGEIKGAVYLPQSEFSCFSGTLNGGQMNLSIVDPYDGSKYAYSISLQSSSPMASNAQVSEMNLQGYHRLNKISDNDHRILSTCLKE